MTFWQAALKSRPLSPVIQDLSLRFPPPCDLHTVAAALKPHCRVVEKLTVVQLPVLYGTQNLIMVLVAGFSYSPLVLMLVYYTGNTNSVQAEIYYPHT